LLINTMTRVMNPRLPRDLKIVRDHMAHLKLSDETTKMMTSLIR